MTSVFSGDSQSSTRDSITTYSSRLCLGRRIEIHEASNHEVLAAASGLVAKMYRWKGYACGQDVDADPHLTSFVAMGGGAEPLGTISVRYDSREGLRVDRLYLRQSQQLRRSGRRLCEMTKFAVDRQIGSRQFLARMFYAGFAHAYYIKGVDDLLIEVNPSHVGFYVRQLCFEQYGAERWNRHVNAPSVLLRLQLDHAAHLISRCSGKPRKDGSLYSLVEPRWTEEVLGGRALHRDPAAASTASEH
jgi:hypothetical protein